MKGWEPFESLLSLFSDLFEQIKAGSRAHISVSAGALPVSAGQLQLPAVTATAPPGENSTKPAQVLLGILCWELWPLTGFV